MLRHPVETLPYVARRWRALAGDYRILLITKGDLFDQERKLAESGLGELLRRGRNRQPERRPTPMPASSPATATARHASMMVGNSLRSDIVPAIAAGSWAVFIPHALTWVVEHDEPPVDAPRYRQLDNLGELIPLIRAIA